MIKLLRGEDNTWHIVAQDSEIISLCGYHGGIVIEDTIPKDLCEECNEVYNNA